MPNRLFPAMNYVLSKLHSRGSFSIGFANPNDTLQLDQWTGNSEDYWRRVHSVIKHSTVKSVIAIYKNGALYGGVVIKSKGKTLIVDRIDTRVGITQADIRNVFTITTVLAELFGTRYGSYNRIVLKDVLRAGWPHCLVFGYTCSNKKMHCGSCVGCSNTYMSFEK